MAKISLNSVPDSIFAGAQGACNSREDFIAEGRLLMYEHARRGHNAINAAMGINEGDTGLRLNAQQYRQLNEQFQAEHLLYAAKLCAERTGRKAPADMAELRMMGASLYADRDMYKVLQGIYTEIVTPILMAVYSDAVSTFAEVVEVGFGETYSITVGSNDIPVFQDSSWGASRSVPRNRLYTKDYTLNPQPKTAQITAKWMQLIANGMDFGAFFANIVAGMYAKTMGLWSSAMTAAATDTALIPSGLTATFSNQNWITIANKVATLSGTRISNVIAHGSAIALSKVLPTTVTGSSNVNMDAAIATLLGADYTRTGYIGDFMGVRLMPIGDAIVPGTQYSTIDTVLDPNQIWLMAGNGRKPLYIAYDARTPIQIEMDPTQTADFEIGMNITLAMDSAAVFSSKVGLITVA